MAMALITRRVFGDDYISQAEDPDSCVNFSQSTRESRTSHHNTCRMYGATQNLVQHTSTFFRDNTYGIFLVFSHIKLSLLHYYCTINTVL